MLWFGEPWPDERNPAPVCDNPGQRVPVPAGVPCIYCPRVIAPEDQGVWIPYISGQEVGANPAHLSCLMKQIVPNWVQDW